MKKILILLAFIALGGGSVYAQGYTALHYDISFPLGKTSDEVSQVSFRGVGFDFRKFMNPNIAIGFSLGWQVFYERKDFATYTYVGTDGNESKITGVQYSYLNALPFHANVGYYLGEETAQIRPFVGLGVGTTFFERTIEMGLYTTTTDAWQFSMQPEIGLLYQAAPSVGLFTAAKYTQSFNTGKLDAQSYISLNLGIAWTLAN